MTRLPAALCAFLMICTAPVTPAIAATGGSLRPEDYRVARIGFRLAVAGARFCPSLTPLAGLGLQHLADFKPADRPEAIARFGLDRGPGIVSVVEDSPAARAGLIPGDILLAIDGISFPLPGAMAIGGNGERRLAMERSDQLIADALARGQAMLTVLRGGAEKRVSLRAVAGCPARVRLARSPQLNAFASRGYAIVTTAMLDFARSDDDLAIILGHEMAHVVLGHDPKPGRRSIVRAQEEAADRLGLRLAWAAGYDIAAAIPVWRRLAARSGPHLFSDHPGREAREEIVRETISDLGAQRPELGESALPQR